MPLNLRVPMGPLVYTKRLNGRGTTSFLYWFLIGWWLLPLKWFLIGMVWSAVMTYGAMKLLLRYVREHAQKNRRIRP